MTLSRIDERLLKVIRSNTRLFSPDEILILRGRWRHCIYAARFNTAWRGVDRVLVRLRNKHVVRNGLLFHRLVPEDITYLHSCDSIDRDCYHRRCILRVEVPRSPARQDFSVFSTFAAPYSGWWTSTDGSISADNARRLQPAGYTTQTTVCGRRKEKYE